MEKAALPVPHVVALILGLLAILFLGYIVMGPGKDMALGILRSLGLIPQRDLTPVEMAIRCSYYRCEEGCNSDDITDLEIPILDPNTGQPTVVSCKTKFCDEVPVDFKEGEKKDKVCNEGAIDYPVEINTLDDMESREVSRGIVGADFGCIVSESTKGSVNLLDIGSLLGAVTAWINWISVPDAYLDTENRVDDCKLANVQLTDALDEFTLAPGKYYISSQWAGGLSGVKLTTIAATPSYLTIDRLGIEGQKDLNFNLHTGDDTKRVVVIQNGNTISDAIIVLTRFEDTFTTSMTVNGETKTATFRKGETRSLSFGIQNYTLYLYDVLQDVNLVVHDVKFKIFYGAICSAMSFPSSTWQRVWYAYLGGGCLGNGQNQDILQFNNPWGTGTVVSWGSISYSDNVEMHSSRTINLAAGTYVFTLGSDDGVRLWIDGVERPLCDINNNCNSWSIHGYRRYNYTVTFSTATNHQFEIHWFESTNDARLSFEFLRHYYCCRDAAGNPTATCSGYCQNGYYLGPSTASNCGGYCSATPCTGNVALGLSPNPVERGQTVTASFSGLSSCSGRRAHVTQISCSIIPITSCTVSGSGCLANWRPTAVGTFTYYGCIDKNSDGDWSDSGESTTTSLTVTNPI